MRKAIYQYLTERCQPIKSWHQPYSPDKDTPKPYGVIVIGEAIQSPFNRRGFFREVYVWPYFGGNSFVALDEAVREIRNLLDGATLTTDKGNEFTLEWVNEGRDFRDDDLKAITRRIDFRVPLVGVGL